MDFKILIADDEKDIVEMLSAFFYRERICGFNGL